MNKKIFCIYEKPANEVYNCLLYKTPCPYKMSDIKFVETIYVIENAEHGRCPVFMIMNLGKNKEMLEKVLKENS